MKKTQAPQFAHSVSEYSQNANKKKRFSLTDYFVLALTFTLLFSSVLILYYFHPYFEKIQLKRLEGWGGQLFFGSSMFLLGIQLLFLVYIFYQYFKYKPVKPVTDDQLLPTCTVIVPAYNEGRLVYDTLLSLAQSDFPADKLEIISFDDGSKDDTWEWMQKAKAVLGSRVEIYQQPKNKGKRHALYRGFKLGKGEVFITVDSDSIVKKDTLRQLVSPFVNNSLCGAVGGNVLVLNTQDGIIPKMLNVSFVFSFEFIRSAQSALNSVLCTPGALAAYRREAVMNCLEEWIHQTFMGTPSDIGEDRAMTNMILKQGYHVLFQKNAYVLTNTPENFKGLYKMFIRWERSNVRENIMMSKFAFTKFRKGSTTGSRILLLNQWLKVILAYPMTMLMLYFVLSYPIMFISSALAGILIFSSIQVIFYAKKYNIKDSFWAYTYSIFYTFALFWITPYAIATANRRGWLTRTLPVK
ncbi:glycosyltransferase [Myroides odoratus]|uniref:glycosyltransferase n=1 Tax=Myroides odoratus TaxID=256 RepID=UPI0039B07268